MGCVIAFLLSFFLANIVWSRIKGFKSVFCCVLLSARLLSFFLAKKERTKEKRHFWQTAPQPKEALLRVLVARVILFVCAGATAPHVLAPLFVFFLSTGTFACFSALFLRTVHWHLIILLSFNHASDNFILHPTFKAALGIHDLH